MIFRYILVSYILLDLIDYFIYLMGCANEPASTSQPQSKGSGDKFEQAVNTIFDKYDKDKSGFLDKA